MSFFREGFIMHWGEAFSGGVFLAAAILDLLPDSFSDFGNSFFFFFFFFFVDKN